MQKLIVRTGLLGAFVLSLIGLWLSFSNVGMGSNSVHDQYCFYHLYDKADRDIKVALMGSSRFMYGIDADQLADELGLDPSQVVNFAHSGRSYDYDLHVLRHITARNDIDLLIIEAILPPEARVGLKVDVTVNGQLISGQKIALASLSELWDVAQANDVSSVSALQNFANLVKAKISRNFLLLISGRTIRALFISTPETEREVQNSCWRTNFDWAEVMDRRGKAVANVDGLRVIDDPAEADYLTFKKDFVGMAALADQENGPKIIFLMQPAAELPAPSDASVQEFEAITGKPMWVVPPEMMQVLRPHFWDPTHVDANGRPIMTSWLAGELAPIVRALDDAASVESVAP